MDTQEGKPTPNMGITNETNREIEHSQASSGESVFTVEKGKESSRTDGDSFDTTKV